MKFFILPTVVCLLAFTSCTSLYADVFFPQDTGTFVLHKFQQPIGKEKYSFAKHNDSLRLVSDFKFKDRGQQVPLRTTLVLNDEGTPVYFKIKGSTSRSSVVDVELWQRPDSTIVINGKREHFRTLAPRFSISGYAPVAVQMQMISFWKRTGKPASMEVLPKGTIQIKLDGTDTVRLSGSATVLERYLIHGLIWGNEIVWTDNRGNLVALFTNDAEGDKFEAMREQYVDALPLFISKAAYYGLRSMKIESIKNDAALLLKNATVVDVQTGQLQKNVDILVERGMIKKIAPVIKAPKGALVINASAKYVAPGLWDMHAHFQQVEWGPAYLAAGVTTVRDCGNEFDFINAVQRTIDNGQGIGPKIRKAGIIDGDGEYALGIIRANTPEEARAAVKRYKDNGFEQIKIYSSVKPEVIKAIADAAHGAGLPVTGHIPIGVKLEDAIKLGQDQINHFTFIYSAMRAKPDAQTIDVNDTTSQHVLKMLKEHGTVVDPTLGIYEWVLRPLDQPLDAFEPGVMKVSEDLKEIFRNTGLPPEQAGKRKDILKSGKAIVLAMHKMGIPIVAGTDMMVPGFSLHRELELYQDAGLSPAEALQTATITPARVMNVDQQVGSVTEGKQADLIILDKNPLEDIHNIRTITKVIKGGKIYDPSALRKLVDFMP